MRQCKSGFIQTYVNYVAAGSEAPPTFNWWAAVTIVAATLKRNVWVTVRGLWKLYPNVFTILVGPPGTGKGEAVNPALELLNKANTANVISDRITIEYVLEKLSKGFPVQRTRPGVGILAGQESSALIFSPELSVFTKRSDALGDLCDLWDCREGTRTYGTRYKGDYPITNPCISLLGGSAPQWLVKSIPNDAVGGGFTRRVNFVYASQRIDLPFFGYTVNHQGLKDQLIDDLRAISLLSGEVKFDVEAQKIFEPYKKASTPQIFDDEATTVYKTSKWAHAAKLAMAISASRDDSLIVTKADISLAIKTVDEVTDNIGRVFRAVGESDFVSASNRVLEFIEKKGVASFNEILRANYRHVMKDELERIITTLLTAGIIMERVTGRTTLYQIVGGNP